jgi:hypothetical protein
MLNTTDNLDVLALANAFKGFLPLPVTGGEWRIVVRRSVASVGILGNPEARLILSGNNGEWGFVDFHLRSARVAAINGPMAEDQKYKHRPAEFGAAVEAVCRANNIDCGWGNAYVW